jgi:hypothetical protein
VLLRAGSADGGAPPAQSGIEILNDVLLNQVLVRCGDRRNGKGHREGKRDEADGDTGYEIAVLPSFGKRQQESPPLATPDVTVPGR